MHLKILSAKWQPFCPGGGELNTPAMFLVSTFEGINIRLWLRINICPLWHVCGIIICPIRHVCGIIICPIWHVCSIICPVRHMHHMMAYQMLTLAKTLATDTALIVPDLQVHSFNMALQAVFSGGHEATLKAFKLPSLKGKKGNWYINILKWLPFCRWHFKMHFYQRKPLCFDLNFTEVCSKGAMFW